jgi:hypothetical protein
MKLHGVWFCQNPAALHCCGMPELGLHRRLPGVHSPVHVPLPEHTNWHGDWDCQIPVLLQNWGTPFAGLQRPLPGEHSPPQAPFTHANWQAAGGENWPWSLHVCNCVSDEHRAVPGMHSPVQALPAQAF